MTDLKVPDDNNDLEKFSKDNLPKSKEQWEALQAKDPILFGNLTQQNVDRLFRENKELQEIKANLENQKSNLSVELENYRKRQITDIPIKPKIPVPKEVIDDKTQYSIHHLPSTTEEWEDLAIDNPNLHADLRFYYNQERVSSEVSYESAQRKARQTVQKEHPDMYLPELDGSGLPKKDAEGKVILKLDARTGEPIFNHNSEKGKLWIQTYEENPDIVTTKNAPVLLMTAMERKLRERAERSLPPTGANFDNQVVHDGVTPPVQKEVKFDSEVEKLHVEKAILRGVYRDATHYLDEKKKGNEGIYDENRTPQFGIKKQ